MNAQSEREAGSVSGNRPARYSERWWAPVGWWAFVVVMAGSFWIAVAAAIRGPAGHLIGLAVSVLCLIGLLVYSRLRVSVTEGGLDVGTARLPVSAIGSVLPLSAGQATALRGPAADATARMFLRPYISRGVRVEVTDPGDPTPYWYVASRRPELLAAALDAARGSQRS